MNKRDELFKVLEEANKMLDYEICNAYEQDCDYCPLYESGSCPVIEIAYNIERLREVL